MRKRERYILLGWAKGRNKKEYNFGDALAPKIIEELSGAKIIQMPLFRNYFWFALMTIKRLIIKPYPEGMLFLRVLLGKKFLLSLGSILQFYNNKKANVWGSGAISNSSLVAKNNYLAVRGPKTRDLILKQGGKAPEVYGDPAILLSLIYQDPIEKRVEIGLTPHISHYEKISLQNFKSEIKVINFNTEDINNIINEIKECKYILSSSLHGLIVAHSFNIPALWIDLGMEKLIGHDFKFIDYFQSVGIKPYKPISIEMKDFSSVRIKELFIQFKDQALPQFSIPTLQIELLKSAPFILLPKYNVLTQAYE